MKKIKILSLFLAGTLLFHTTGIDVLATEAADPVSVSESAADPEKESSEEISGEKNPEPSSTEDGESEDNPEQPSAENNETKDSTEAEEKDTENKEDSEDEENPNEQEPVENEELTADEENSEDTVSENTISENTLPEEEEDAFDIFPGLGDSYTMSSQQMADKRELAAHVGDIIEKNTRKAEDYPDAEGLYELGEVVYLAETEAEAKEMAEAFGGTLDSYSYEVAVISLPEKATVAMAVAAAAEPDLKLPAVWPNYYDYLDSDISEINAIGSTKATDDEVATQWQHDYIGTTYAWAAGFTGDGIKVAVIDTGLQKGHEDLSANAKDGKNFVNGANGTTLNTDNQTHGTHVAGIIAADDNGKGGVGIAPDATVTGYCVFPTDKNESTKASDCMAAINAAVGDGNTIINMSLGGPMYNGLYAETVQKAYNKGVAIFASSGNDDTDANNFPAAYPGVISVGAVDQNSARASFSNYGSTVKLSFPGVHIYSTLPSGYGYMSGTSQACPAAAGTAAVILSAREDIRSKSGKARVDALLSAMKTSTTKCTNSGMGAGTTWLPGVLKIATDMTVPDAPVISIKENASDKAGKTYIAEQLNVTLAAKTAVGVKIYYTTDGKSPTYKNGEIMVGTEYTAPFSVGDAKNINIKAIAVNPITGKVSKVATKACVLTPNPRSVSVASADGIASGKAKIAAGKTLKLTAIVTPSYAISTKVVWNVDSNATAQGITVANGTVKTKASTKAGTYTVTATATQKDGKTTINNVKCTYTFNVIDSTTIKKVAFLDNNKKALKAQNLDTGKTFPLKDYLTVTKTDAKAKKDTDLTGTVAADEVVWSSTNTNVATVTDGVIEAVAPGKATIKAISNDGGNKSASYTVTVVQPVTEITLSGPQKVAAGKGITLTAAIQPVNATNKKLDWKVSGNGNVTVNTSGKVTVKKNATGTFNVIATAKDGSNKSSAAYTVNIVSGEIKTITLSTKALTLFVPAKNSNAATTGTLKATVTGSGADTSLIQWTSSAPSIASVDPQGNVTALSAGKAIITCASTDGSNKKATCTVNVTIPMSKLAIGPADSYGDYDGQGYFGYIAAGKSIKMSAKYSSNYGDPTNKKVTWASSNNNILTVDKSGKVTANKNAKVGSEAIITATAADGSGVISNQYTFIVSPLYKRIYIDEYRSVVGVRADGKIDELNLTYYTVAVSGGKNPGLSKKWVAVSQTSGYYTLMPIPGQQTTSKTTTSGLTTKDALKMTVTAKLRDGSGLTAKFSIYMIRLPNGSIYIGKTAN